ncbi:MAG: hypothetical protein JJ974_06815 [Phycisphaerales bacterium]|nr:hypothetical protein [Phycisphaerales bacterium]
MSQIEKKCVFCALSCAGQPRIKDADGNYAHKACAEKHQAKQHAIEQEELGLSPEEPEMSAFLDDLPESSDTDQGSTLRAACPSCGTSVTGDAVICMSCGCNLQTGKNIKISVGKSKSPRSGPSLGAKAGSMALAPILPIIGASIGGAIGAAAWAAVVYFFNYELGILAAGVGFICGLGAVIGARGEGNAWSGMVAVVIALVSIVVGKSAIHVMYLATLEDIQSQIESEMASTLTADSLDEFQIYQGLVDEIAEERISNRVAIDWPDPDMTLDEAYWPEDYPQDLIEETETTWSAMTPEAQGEFREARAAYLNEGLNEYNEMLQEEIAAVKDVKLADTLSPFDALWALLALGAAWGVGSGGND